MNVAAEVAGVIVAFFVVRWIAQKWVNSRKES